MTYKLKAVLFDFDGVVVDTESQYTVFWEKIGSLYVPDDKTFAKSLKGCTLKEIFNKHFPSEDTRAEIKHALEDFQKTMNYSFIPGVENFIAELKANGIITAVVTASDKTKMNAVYNVKPEIKDMFNRVFTSEDYKESKPSPDCYISAARHFELAPAQCIVMEDSVNGLKAAAASGSAVIGLATTNPRSVVSKYSDKVIDNFINFGYRDALEVFYNKFSC